MTKKLNIKPIIIAIILVLLLGGLFYFIISESNQEDKLRKEMKEISELTNEDILDEEKINKKINEIVTKGKVGEVEKVIKQYLKDNFNNTVQIADIVNDQQIIDYLTLKNYKNDGPDFIETLESIKNKKEKLEELKGKYLSFFKKETAMAYIENKGLEDNYLNLFEELVLNEIKEDDDNLVVEDSINDLIAYLEKTEEVINFLKENKNKWNVENEELIFNSTDLANKYNELINNL